VLVRAETGAGYAVDGGVRNSSVLRLRDERQAARVSSVLFLAGAFLLTACLVVEPTPSAPAEPAVAVPLLGGLLVFAALPHVVAHARLTRGPDRRAVPTARRPCAARGRR
jgi:peptidoglycan/LPS O-acetylase OafA/YrhL